MDRKKDKWIERKIDRKEDRSIERKINEQKERQIDIQKDWQRYIDQIDIKWMDRKTSRYRIDRYTQIDRKTLRKYLDSKPRKYSMNYT